MTIILILLASMLCTELASATTSVNIAVMFSFSALGLIIWAGVRFWKGKL